MTEYRATQAKHAAKSVMASEKRKLMHLSKLQPILNSSAASIAKDETIGYPEKSAEKTFSVDEIKQRKPNADLVKFDPYIIAQDKAKIASLSRSENSGDAEDGKQRSCSMLEPDLKPLNGHREDLS